MTHFYLRIRTELKGKVKVFGQGGGIKEHKASMLLSGKVDFYSHKIILIAFI